MDYFYLVSSLPPLRLDDPPPWTSESFRESCEGLLREEDLASLDRLQAEQWSEAPHPWVQRWGDVETVLRNDLARGRATDLSRDVQHWLRGFEHFEGPARSAAHDALSMENPLAAERLLDEFRWNTSADLALSHPFGAEQVFVHAIRLRLVERWHRLTVEGGREELEASLEELTRTLQAP